MKNEFIIEIACANQLDTFNRISNKLAGRDFLVKELSFKEFDAKESRCYLRISAIRNELELCLCKLLNYPDVFSYKTFVTIQNDKGNNAYESHVLHA